MYLRTYCVFTLIVLMLQIENAYYIIFQNIQDIHLLYTSIIFNMGLGSLQLLQFLLFA